MMRNPPSPSVLDEPDSPIVLPAEIIQKLAPVFEVSTTGIKSFCRSPLNGVRRLIDLCENGGRIVAYT